MSIFQKIISREAPGDIVWESERAVAIRDIHPLTPIHLLIIPKKEYPDLQSIPADELDIIAHIVSAAQNMASKFGVSDGYRLTTNVGASAGQSIVHLHFHLLAGRELGSMG